MAAATSRHGGRHPGEEAVRLQCNAEAQLGSLTIPAAALARLQGGIALLTVEHVSEQHVQAGDFDVELSVRNHYGFARFDLR